MLFLFCLLIDLCSSGGHVSFYSLVGIDKSESSARYSSCLPGILDGSEPTASGPSPWVEAALLSSSEVAGMGQTLLSATGTLALLTNSIMSYTEIFGEPVASDALSKFC